MKGPAVKEAVGTLARGVSVNLVGKFIGRALHLIAQIVLARWLGPVLFGLYAIGWNLMRVASSVLPLGMDVAVLEQGGGLWPDQADKAGRLSLRALWLTLVIGIGSAGLLYWQAGSLAEAFQKAELAGVIKLFAVMLPLAMGLKVAASATRVSRLMRYGAIAEEVVQPVSHLILLGLLLLGWQLGLHGAIWAGTISFALALLLALTHLKTLFGISILPVHFDLAKGLKLLKVSAPIAAAGAFATLLLLTDRLLVGYFLSEADAGLYQALSMFSVFFVTVLTAFKTIAAPMLSTAHRFQDPDELRRAYQLSTRWSLYLSLPVAAVLIAAPEQAMRTVFGDQYLGAGTVLIVLTLGQLANLLTGPVDHMLMMTGFARLWTWITGAVFVLNLALNWVLIPQLGLLGAAWATLISFALTSLFAAAAVWSIHRIWPYEVSLLKGAFAMLVVVLVVALGAGIQWGAAWIEMIGLTVLAFVAFLFTIKVLGLSADDEEALVNLRAMFRAEKE